MVFGWCSDLGLNAFTGSVPSSLSALTDLETLCETPRAAACLCVLPRALRSVGSAPCAAAQSIDGVSANPVNGAAVGVFTVLVVVTGEPCGTLEGLGSRSPSAPAAAQSREVWLSPLWICSDLGNNALTGSMPSSLSALRNLRELCVAPCAA